MDGVIATGNVVIRVNITVLVDITVVSAADRLC